jgi:hypothetical protein
MKIKVIFIQYCILATIGFSEINLYKSVRASVLKVLGNEDRSIART